MRRKTEITIVAVLAVLVLAGLIALAAKKERRPPLAGGPIPPGGL